MKERPILYSAPMVRALLAGKKLMTRRVAKLTANGHVKEPGGHRRWHPADPDASLACPYGQPGDRLWVREAWRTYRSNDKARPRDLTTAHKIWFEADGKTPNPAAGKLRPGMFMPRWASRITLEVTGVRVERLQDISEADCISEGIARLPPPPEPHDWSGPNRFTLAGMGSGACAGSVSWSAPTAQDLYQRLWEEINGPESWAANPWVWCVSFKRLEAA